MKLFSIVLASICFYTFQLRAQFTCNWKFKAKSAIYSSATTDSQNVYFGCSDSIFYALNKLSGEEAWRYQTLGSIKSKPCIFKDLIIFNNTEGKIFALNKDSGKLVWLYKTKGEKRYDMWDYYLSSPVTHNGQVFIGSGDSCIYSLNATTGNLNWKFKTLGIVHASAVINGNSLFIGGFDGYFYALNCQTGKLIWKFDTVGDRYFPKGEVQTAAAIYKNTVIFGSRDYNIYSLDINTGNGVWNMKERGSWVIATPFVHDENIYLGTSDSHKFYCLSAEDGEIKWTLPLNMRVYGTAASHSSSIIFGCFNGKTYSVNSQSGKVESIFQTNESKLHYPAIYNKEDHFKEGFELYGKSPEQSEKTILGLGAFVASPLVEKGTLYCGDTNGYFYSIKCGISN